MVVTRHDRYAKSKLMAAWRGKFEKIRYNVTPVEVSKLIREDLEGEV